MKKSQLRKIIKEVMQESSGDSLNEVISQIKEGLALLGRRCDYFRTEIPRRAKFAQISENDARDILEDIVREISSASSNIFELNDKLKSKSK